MCTKHFSCKTANEETYLYEEQIYLLALVIQSYILGYHKQPAITKPGRTFFLFDFIFLI